MALRIQGVDVHKSRWVRFRRLGHSMAEIAADDDVKESTVKASIDMVEAREALSGLPELNNSQAQIINALAPEEQKAIREALGATKTQKNPNTLQYEIVADHTTRLAAVEVVNKKLAALQPRGGGVRVGVAVGLNAPGAPPVPTMSGPRPRSFEELSRQLRGAPAALPEPPPATVITVAEDADAD